MSNQHSGRGQVNMVDLVSEYLDMKTEIDSAIGEVLSSGQFIKGPVVKRFETELAEYCQCRNVIGVANGTDALQVALMAMEVGPGDEVITTPFTFVATAETIALLGARPVFVDIDPETFNIDPNGLSAALSNKTKAIIPVHLFGQPADMDAVMEAAEDAGVPVIEDNAQAVGATYNGRMTGSFGALATISFFPTKNLGCYGDGGAVTTNDDALAERVAMIANHGARRKYFNEIVGVNSRLDAIQAAILRVKLARLDDFNARRMRVAETYDRLLAAVEGVDIPVRAAGRSHIFHQYTVRLAPGVDRDSVASHLKLDGISSAVYYPTPLNLLPAYDGDHSRVVGSLVHATAAAASVLSLPIHPGLDHESQERVVDSLVSALESQGVGLKTVVR